MNLISGISSILAIGLLTPVQSILFMIILFVSIAFSLYAQGYVLMGILYIMIYVGAIAILFLFILSLLKIDYINHSNKSSNNTVSIFILTFLIILFLPLDLSYVSDFRSELGNIIISENVYTAYNELITVGSVLYTDYSILMLITGIILILSVIGAISITK